MTERAATPARIKELIVGSLNLDVAPDSIGDELPLFGEGLGLDSVDALELVVALEKEFSIKIEAKDAGRELFRSVATIARYVDGRLAEREGSDVHG